MADPEKDSDGKDPHDKAPTAEDIKKLQSVMDKQLAAKDKELAELKAKVAGAKPAVEDDLGLKEKSEALVKEQEEFKKAKVAWHRDRVSAEYGLKSPEDKKALDGMDDPRDMELYALKKTKIVQNPNRSGADREPTQTGTGASYQDRMRSGLETRFKKLFE